MQLVTHFADQRDQLLLDKVMDVFRLIVNEQRWRCGGARANFLEALQNADQFLGTQHSGILQRPRMRAASGNFVLQQALVEIKRALPALETGIQDDVRAGGLDGR